MVCSFRRFKGALMCGICGSINPSGAAPDTGLIGRMVDVQRHRGPDGDGKFFAPGVGFGHLRLSIIDVDGGAQPIANDDGSLQIIFNGEIYNFVELRQELEAMGHRFRTRSDTEVILRGYEQWGRDVVLRLNGMFSFAIADLGRRRVFLARDHLGIKPLYHATIDGTIYFASEVKALVQHPRFSPEVDPQSLSDLFTFRYVPSPRTLFRGVHKVPPGHWMEVSEGGVELHRYWTTVPSEFSTASEADLIAEYQDLLEDATRIQMRSDVPVGLFLSAGVDSAGLLALMSQHTSEPVRTFTIGFQDGEGSSEMDGARTLAAMFGAQHEERLVSAEDYQSYYDRYMWDLEEPVGNETAAAFHFVSEIAARHVKVALTGQGADEPWAGYRRYLGAKLSTYYSKVPTPVTDAIGGLVSAVPGRFERLKRGALALGERDMLTRLVKTYSFFDADMKDKLFRDDFVAQLGGYDPASAIAPLQSDVAGLDALTQMLYVDTRAGLPDDLLMVCDKMAMAHSLETRVPYLDYRIVELVERIPPHLKLKGLTGKYLHKKALEKWLPSDVVWQKKKGFANPVDEWFRTRMKGMVDDILLSKDAAVASYFDQAYIRTLLEADRSGAQPYRRHIYLLVSFELWHRRFIGS